MQKIYRLVDKSGGSQEGPRTSLGGAPPQKVLGPSWYINLPANLAIFCMYANHKSKNWKQKFYLHGNTLTTWETFSCTARTTTTNHPPSPSKGAVLPQPHTSSYHYHTAPLLRCGRAGGRRGQRGGGGSGRGDGRIGRRGGDDAV